jgi:hypothetical protein
MPEGFSVNIPSNMLETLGQYAAAAKVAQTEIKKARQEAAMLEKEGKAVPKNLTTRISSLEDRRTQLIAKEEARTASQRQYENVDAKIAQVHSLVQNVASGNIFTTSNLISGAVAAPAMARSFSSAVNQLTKFRTNIDAYAAGGSEALLDTALKHFDNFENMFPKMRGIVQPFIGAKLYGTFLRSLGSEKALTTAGYALKAGKFLGLGGTIATTAAGAAGYALGSLIMAPSIGRERSRAEANAILTASQGTLSAFILRNRYTSAYTAEQLAHVNNSSMATFNRVANTPGMGYWGAQFVMAAQAQAYTNEVSLMALHYGPHAASRLSIDNISRNNQIIKLALDRDRGRDIGFWSALWGTIAIPADRGEWDRSKSALGGRFKAAWENVKWAVTWGNTDAEKQEKKELSIKMGKKMSEDIETGRAARHTEATTRPEYKALQTQRSLHLRAVEEMKYHKFAQWNTF